MKKIITEADINNAKQEYVELGKDLQFFRGDTISSTECRLRGIDFKIDNSIPGDARTSYDNGRASIIINTNECLSHTEKHYLDEVIFHEMSHVNNEIQRDFYVYSSKRIMSFKEEYKRFATDLLVRYPEWGFILLDEVIAQYTAQKMVERKYGGKPYEDYHFFITDLTKTRLALGTKLSDYPEGYKFADAFAKTIYDGEDSLYRLCVDAYAYNLLDNIFFKFRSNPNLIEDYYKLLGYMGNIMLAIYDKTHDFRFSESEYNRRPENVEKSMTLALKTAEKLSKNK